MPNRNVTITLPEETLKAARHLAVEHGVSLSRFFGLLVEKSAPSGRSYEQAKKRSLALMARGIRLGVGKTVTWTRDELHER